MEMYWVFFCFLFNPFVVFQFLPGSTAQLNPSQGRTLLQVQRFLEYPEVLKEWNKWTDFCSLQSSPSVVVVCLGGRVTELTIVGNKSSPSHYPKPFPGKFPVSQGSLSGTFSIDSFFTVLTKLSNLQKLTLVSLGLWGPLPPKISRFSSLKALNISSSFIYGDIPPSLASLKKLSSLVLADNLLNGSLPDLSGLQALAELDLGINQIGPKFPSLGENLVTISLRNNSLRSEIPSQLSKFNQLQRLDLSSNHLIGPIPSFIFSLPALWYLNLADNQLTGAIQKNTNCGEKLWFVDISRNFLIGNLPVCISSKKNSTGKVFSTGNCLSNAEYQHSVSFCQPQALAVEPPSKIAGNQRPAGVRIGLVLGIIGGIVGVVGAACLLVVGIGRIRRPRNGENKRFNKSNSKKKSPIVDSKYVPRVLRLPALGLPPYHDFTLEELEEATNNFDPVNLVGEVSQGQIYKGFLQSGSAVMIKCIKQKQKHTSRSLKQQMDWISQLRHQNLVSVLGHCIVTYQDRNNKGSTVFIVTEHVSNGSLRDHLSDCRRRDVLKWPQRMIISVGIAKGVHFLHSGVAPGIFGHELKIENILLDETLTPKVGGYRMPLPSKAGEGSPLNVEDSSNAAIAEKQDIYLLGVILLEMLTGKQAGSESELQEMKLELQRSLAEPASALQEAVDQSLRGTFAHQSLKTAVEITINCLCEDPKKRPSMEDVLWNLQYSIQVQQAWTSSGNLGLMK
ncbi:hypothetical protein Nepgr_029447 [Nepenthes gracilis]|uniref:non-specific serine/threonine protein kinase n=1 Tax=Nepenthes gracilis TaxID=150966 RepID=A0AAD3TEH7_NEPGR|nr:hypothetical protein Nepgr_029447 [Nepenthes gracilis]